MTPEGLTVDGRRQFLRQMFDAAVSAALPSNCLLPHLPDPPLGRTVVVGAGKAAAAMACIVDDHWQGEMTGIVVTRYGHLVPCRRIKVVEAGHPVPDETGKQAAHDILASVRGLCSDDLVICLWSGGGSSLLAYPSADVSFREKREITKALLKSGATIGEINTVRKHLSAIKGGRLAAAAAPARVISLLISDVPGDDLSVIASGPTAPDPTTSADATTVLEKYRISASHDVFAYLADPASETPKPGDPCFGAVSNLLIATPQMALEAAARVATRTGYSPVILSNSIEGEARDVALVHAAIARQSRAFAQPIRPPCVILSGGETTVTLRGAGRGGRNVEFLLALTIALNGSPNIYALAADTDGIDGTEDNAGAMTFSDTLSRGTSAGVSGRERLADNDGYGFFQAVGDLLISGPTLTNVNDLRVIVIDV